MSSKRRSDKNVAAVHVKTEPMDYDIHAAIESEHGQHTCDSPRKKAKRVKTEATRQPGVKHECEGGDTLRQGSSGMLHAVSPVFPGWPHPTVEDCRSLDEELAVLHGKKVQPPHSGMSVMDSLVATILSQNTTGKNSRASFASLKETFPSWEEVCSAKTSAIEDAIRMGGLAAIKAKRIQEICRTIRAERGRVCLEHLATAHSEAIKDELSRFPGCGPKTISCVLLFNMQRPDFAVDTHVFRLACAAGWVPCGKDVRSHNRRVGGSSGSGKVGRGPGGRAGNGQKKHAAKELATKSRRGDSSTADEGGNQGGNQGGMAWPPVSRETTYLHLNALVPDEFKYSLHVNLIAHGRTLSPAAGPKDASTCPIARRGAANRR